MLWFVCFDFPVKSVGAALIFSASSNRPFEAEHLIWAVFVFCVWIEGGSPESRIQAVHCLVHKLPEKNRLVLGLLMKHLAKWVVRVQPISASSLSLSLSLLFMSVSSFSLHMLFLSISLTPTLFTPPSLLSLHLFLVYSLLANKLDFFFAFSWAFSMQEEN